MAKRFGFARNDVPDRKEEKDVTGNGPMKGPASYFPAIEKKYGRPVAEWETIVRTHLPAKHMALVAMLKDEHQMGHGHANAIVAHVLAHSHGTGEK